MALRGDETQDIIDDFKKALIIVLMSGIFGSLMGIIFGIF